MTIEVHREIDERVKEILCEPLPKELEHKLRERIERTRSRVIVSERPRFSRRLFGWAALAGGATAAALAVPLLPSGGTVAWAEVAEAASSVPWMHMSGKHANGTQIDFWLSFPRGIFAMKAGDAEFAVHQARRTNTRRSYRKSDGVIREQNYSRPPGELGHLEMLLGQFSAKSENIVVPGTDDIVSQSRRKVVDNGKKAWRYEFAWKAMENGHVDTYVVVFDVDPTTHLPYRWTRKSGSQEMSFAIDYPQSGPETIFELGIPNIADTP